MDFEQNIVFQVLKNFNKNIHYESQLLQRDTVLDIPENSELVILNHSFATISTVQQYELLKQKVGDKDFVLLTSNYYYWENKHPNIIYFPYYYFYFLSLPFCKYDIQKNRQYPMMCFNLSPWYHRAVNLIEMSKRSWFKKCKISFHWVYAYKDYNTTNIGIDTLSRLNQEQKSTLANFQFPILAEDDAWHFFSRYYVSNQSKLYENTYINYITENGVGQVIFTEKTWKPIFSGQLFYILGSINIIKHLRDIGIDVFDDYINHSYDSENNLDKKIDLILNDLDRLMQMNLDKVWQDTYTRRLKNFDLVHSQDFKNLLANDLVKKVS